MVDALDAIDSVGGGANGSSQADAAPDNSSISAIATPQMTHNLVKRVLVAIFSLFSRQAALNTFAKTITIPNKKPVPKDKYGQGGDGSAG
jgi:hypothetical protein